MLLPKSLTSYSVQFWPQPVADALLASDVPAAAESITVVTAFFDIDRGSWDRSASEVSGKYKRSVEHYFSNFKRLARLKNDLIVFTSSELAPEVLALRSGFGLSDRTIILTIDDLFTRPGVKETLEAIAGQLTDQFRDFVWRPGAPEYNKADYVLVNALKTTFVCTAIEFALIRSAQVAWIDFGYAGADGIVDDAIEWAFDFGDKINLFNIFNLDDRPIYDVVRGGEVYIQGCHIVGPTLQWNRFNSHMAEALASLIDCNLMDDDQTLMVMAVRRHPDAFTLRRHPIDPELGWRFIFRRFQIGQSPVDHSLPNVRFIGQPAWFRDLKTFLRRRLRRVVRSVKAH